MIDNLRIALKRQKKLILIFFLTIFIPAISLSIFGIGAIRSERFRLVQQIENEHRRAADLISAQVNAYLDELELAVQNLARSPAIRERNFPEAQEALANQLKIHPVVEHIILQYKDEKPWFPSSQAYPSESREDPLEALSQAQANILSRAEEAEFRQKQYAARALCNILYSQAGDLTVDRFSAQ